MSEEYVTITELSKEIFKEIFQTSNEPSEDFLRTMRKKFNFFMNRVALRSKLQWRYKKKDRIPLCDKDIVKELLIKSYNSADSNDLFVKWFNSSIKDDDYDSIIRLGYKIETLIDEEIYADDWDKDLDDVTKEEWKDALTSSINLSRALSVKNFAREMIRLYDSSNVLNHGINLGDIISVDKNGKRSFVFRGKPPHIDTTKPISEIIKGCFSQEDYVNLVLQLMCVIEQDATNKAIDCIKFYAVLKKHYDCSSADELINSKSLASEYPKFFQNIYEYLYDRPSLTKAIEEEIGTDNLLNFFKMKDRNAKNPKKTNKD